MKARLLARGLPRLQMTLIVTCTGAAGFVASFLLLHLGLRLPALRYAVAVAAAYGVFLLLVRLWLAVQRRRLELPDGGGFDLDLGGGGRIGGSVPGSGGGGFSGGGGRFGGGGATALFDDGAGGTSDASAQALAAVSADSSPSSSGGSGSGFSLDLNLDGDDWFVVVAIGAVLVVCFGASIYVITSAPVLFAEVLVDGSLSAGLYRHVKGLDEESWLEAALRRTWLPFAAVAAMFVAAGVVFHKVAPEAASIGGVIRHVLR